MNQLSDIIIEKRTALNFNKSEMADKLGISSQLYGQYEKGDKMPGGDFFIKWKEVFNENLTDKIETNVSRELGKKNSTNQIQEQEPSYEFNPWGKIIYDLTTSNKLLAESNKILADGQMKLIKQLNLTGPSEASFSSEEKEKAVVDPDPTEILGKTKKGLPTIPYQRKGKSVAKDK